MAAARRSRSEWEQLVREQEDSSLSVRAFAFERGVNPSTLSWWRWRVRSEAGGASVTDPITRFVPVVVSAQEREVPKPETGTIEAELPCGVVLRFEHRLDPRGLRDLAMAFGQEG